MTRCEYPCPVSFPEGYKPSTATDCPLEQIEECRALQPGIAKAIEIITEYAAKLAKLEGNPIAAACVATLGNVKQSLETHL